MQPDAVQGIQEPQPQQAPPAEATASPPVAGVAPAETAPQKSNIDPNFPHLSESNIAQSAEAQITPTAPNIQAEPAITPGAAIAETLAGTPPPNPEPAPEPTPQQAPAPQVENTPGIVRNRTTAEGLAEGQPNTTSPEAAQPAPDVIAGVDPNASTSPESTNNQPQVTSSDADIIKTMEPGSAGFTRNDGTPIEDVPSQPTPAETPAPTPTEINTSQNPESNLSSEMQKKLAGSIMSAQYLLEEMRKNPDADIVAMAPDVAKQTLINTSTNIITPPSVGTSPESKLN